MRLKQVKCLENPLFNSTIDSSRKLCPPDQVEFNCFNGEDVGHFCSTRTSIIYDFRLQIEVECIPCHRLLSS